jgi:hypothetical protein
MSRTLHAQQTSRAHRLLHVSARPSLGCLTLALVGALIVASAAASPIRLEPANGTGVGSWAEENEDPLAHVQCCGEGKAATCYRIWPGTEECISAVKQTYAQAASLCGLQDGWYPCTAVQTLAEECAGAGCEYGSELAWILNGSAIATTTTATAVATTEVEVTTAPCGATTSATNLLLAQTPSVSSTLLESFAEYPGSDMTNGVRWFVPVPALAPPCPESFIGGHCARLCRRAGKLGLSGHPPPKTGMRRASWRLV